MTTVLGCSFVVVFLGGLILAAWLVDPGEPLVRKTTRTVVRPRKPTTRPSGDPPEPPPSRGGGDPVSSSPARLARPPPPRMSALDPSPGRQEAKEGVRTPEPPSHHPKRERGEDGKEDEEGET